jgi:hypothetical protein
MDEDGDAYGAKKTLLNIDVLSAELSTDESINAAN